MLEFNVTGMTCQHCSAAITAAIHQQDPTAVVDIDLTSGRVQVVSTVTPKHLLHAIEQAGYEAELVKAIT
jgi:copper chaperone